MFKAILVPTDGSPLSEKVIFSAVDAAKINGGKIVGISVGYPYPHTRPTEGAGVADFGQVYEDQMRQEAQQHVEQIANAARAMGVPCETITPLSFEPHQEILKAVKEFGCDVIFMASHGRTGLRKLFVGSETQKVLAESSVPVMVFR